jgi:hypothetical protein
MTSRANFGLELKKTHQKTIPHPGFEKVLMRKWDF